jgi:hypothetical protein
LAKEILTVRIYAQGSRGIIPKKKEKTFDGDLDVKADTRMARIRTGDESDK